MSQGRRNVLQDEFFFSGDEEMNTTFDNTAISDQTSNYPGHIADGWPGVVRLTSTDHGFKAPAKVLNTTWEKGNQIYLQNTTNYDGLRQIVAVAANTIDVIAKFVAETPAGTELIRPAISYDVPWEFLGYKLHLSAACATAENFVISVDAKKGAAWDVNILTEAMNGVQDLISIYEEPIPISRDDIVYCTFANTDDRLWGLTLYARRIS